MKYESIKAVSLLVLMTGATHARAPSPAELAAPLQSIAFSSCNRENLAQPLWDDIVAQNPDLWVWGGDVVYADSRDTVVIKQKYNLEKNHAGYGTLLATAPVIGVWDDHDYGENDAFAEYPMKVFTQRYFLQFLDEMPTSPRWTRPGIYGSYTFGSVGQQVRILFLDNRYFADKTLGNVDLLGAAQWAWLDAELSNNTPNVNIFVAGIQIVNEQATAWKFSQWPVERTRFFNLLASKNVKAPVLVTGDRHFGELAKRTGWGNAFPLWEITASGMTHVYIATTPEPNPYRVGVKYEKFNYGMFRFDWANWRLSLEIDGDNRERAFIQTIPLDSIGSPKPSLRTIRSGSRKSANPISRLKSQQVGICSGEHCADFLGRKTPVRVR